jgi:hypothetical protein
MADSEVKEKCGIAKKNKKSIVRPKYEINSDSYAAAISAIFSRSGGDSKSDDLLACFFAA